MLSVVIVLGRAGYLFQMVRGEKIRVEDLFSLNIRLFDPSCAREQLMSRIAWVLKIRFICREIYIMHTLFFTLDVLPLDIIGTVHPKIKKNCQLSLAHQISNKSYFPTSGKIPFVIFRRFFFSFRFKHPLFSTP